MNKLVEVINESGLEVVESKSIIEKFGDYEKVANEWEVKAKQIVVTSVEQKTEMAMAKEARKKFSQLRIDVENARKEMKEQSLRKGQAIDSVARFLKSLIEPVEGYLREQEDFIKIKEAKEAEDKRLEEERLEEIKQLAKEKAEKEEQERIKEENEALKKKADERELILQKERAEKEKIERDFLEKLRIEHEKAEKEKLEAKKKSDAEKSKLEQKLKDTILCPYCNKEFTL